MLLWKEKTDHLSALQARGFKVLRAETVLRFACDFRFDNYHFWCEWIVVVTLMQLKQIFKVHF